MNLIYISILSCVYLVSQCQCGGESLTPKQEDDAIKYIMYEILNTEVHDAATLDECLKKITTLIRPYMPYGLKAWNVPPMEPLYLEKVLVTQIQGHTSFKGIFKEILIYGLSGFTLEYIKSKPESYSFDLEMRFPSLKMLGYYELEGNLLIVHFKDHGSFTANATNVVGIVHAKFDTTDGTLSLSDADTDFTFSKFKFHLDNLFKGSPLGESVNESLNRDVDEVVKELKSAFIKEINKIIVQTLYKGLQYLPKYKWEEAIKH